MRGVSKYVIRIQAAICLCNSGCLAFYTTRPVEITLTDNSTGAAAGGVPVAVEYGYFMILNGPTGTEGITDQRGSVVLPMADFDGGVIILRVGGTRFPIKKDFLRNGGVPIWNLPRNAEKQLPYSVTLTPQKRRGVVGFGRRR